MLRDPELCWMHLSLVLLLILAGPMPAADSEHCDPHLESRADDPLGYRPRGDRCEGRYIQEVANTTLLVASFTESFEGYDLAVDHDLTVEWTPLGEEVVSLRAQALRPRLYYRMDARSSPGESFYHWPIHVLAGLDIASAELGVVGFNQQRVGNALREVHLPLRIRQQESAARSDAYRVVLLLGREFEEVYVSVARVGSDGEPADFLRDGERLGYGYYPAGRGTEFPISGLSEPGIYYLEIGAELEAGGTVSTAIWFHHPGSRPVKP